MTLENLAVVAEIISSLAILFTLVYLAIQTQQMNRTLVGNSRQATMLADVTLLTTAMGAPEFKQLMTGILGRAVGAEFIFFLAFFRIREFAWFQYQSGILDESAFDSYMAPAIRILAREFGAQFWSAQQRNYDPGFAEYLNKRLASTSQ